LWAAATRFEARLAIDYFDYDDPTIVVDPPFTPRPVSSFLPTY